MTLIKWTKPSGLTKQNFETPLDHLFKDFFDNNWMMKGGSGFVPAVNISETEKSYNIELPVPGFNKEDFKVKVENGVLVISGEHKTENTSEQPNYLRREFNYSSFERSFNLAELVDEENIDARYENGILKLELPKLNKSQNQNIREIKIS